MRKRLMERGLSADAARLLMIVGVSDVRRAVWAKLNERDFPEGLDVEWAEHVAKVYLDPEFSWASPRWTSNVGGRQGAIDAVARLGGSALMPVLAQQSKTTPLLAYSKPFLSKWSGLHPASLARYGDWFSSSPDGRGLALIDCPHDGCDGKCTVALWLPETAFGLEDRANVICTSCRRLPVKASPQFPPAYLQLRSEPEQAGDDTDKGGTDSNAA